MDFINIGNKKALFPVPQFRTINEHQISCYTNKHNLRQFYGTPYLKIRFLLSSTDGYDCSSGNKQILCNRLSFYTFSSSLKNQVIFFIFKNPLLINTSSNYMINTGIAFLPRSPWHLITLIQSNRMWLLIQHKRTVP